MQLREPLKAGTVLAGEYRIDQVLGDDGFAITYRAEDVKAARRVVIKEYFPAEFALREGSDSVRARSGERGDAFRSGRARVLEEAQQLARFEHPAISRVIRTFEANDTVYIVLRREEGVALAQHLEGLGRPMTEAEIRRLVYPILEALEQVHAAGMLHRDISPETIVVKPDGRGVLTDFGAARRALAERSEIPAGVASEVYSAPEQCGLGGKAQGPWTDVYALGAALYRMVTGLRPPTAPHRLIEDSMVPARDAGAAHAGEQLLEAIDRAMRLKSVERPQSIAALRAALSGREAPPGQPVSVSAQSPVETGVRRSPRSDVAFDTLAAPRPPEAGQSGPVPGSAAPAATTRGTAGSRPQWMPLGKLLFAFSGRINRAKLWLGFLMQIMVMLVGLLVAAAAIAVAGEGERQGVGPVSWICLGALVLLWSWISLALNWKRAHDRGWSGWFSLLTLVPFLQLWPMIELLFLPGDPGRNRFGVNPLAPDRDGPG